MTVTSFTVGIVVALAGLSGTPARDVQPARPSAAETFHLNVTATASGAAKGAVNLPMTIRIDRYTPEHSLTDMSDALKYRGYPGFLLALRDAPKAGVLEIAGLEFVIRWARQRPADAGRTITLVTDKPVYFVGSGREGAKSTKGYEIALVRLDLDGSGSGTGVMAAAARVKPDGSGGVTIDNYAETPMKLTTVKPPAR